MSIPKKCYFSISTNDSTAACRRRSLAATLYDLSPSNCGYNRGLLPKCTRLLENECSTSITQEIHVCDENMYYMHIIHVI